MNKHECLEFEKRGVLHFIGADFKNNTIIINSKFELRKPTVIDVLKAYLTLTIPAAMLARVIRKTRNRKGTVLENICMKYYYDNTVKLLAKES